MNKLLKSSKEGDLAGASSEESLNNVTENGMMRVATQQENVVDLIKATFVSSQFVFFFYASCCPNL